MYTHIHTYIYIYMVHIIYIYIYSYIYSYIFYYKIIINCIYIHTHTYFNNLFLSLSLWTLLSLSSGYAGSRNAATASSAAARVPAIGVDAAPEQAKSQNKEAAGC